MSTPTGKTSRRTWWVLAVCAALAALAGGFYLTGTSATDTATSQRMVCPLPDDTRSKHPGMVWVPGGTFTMGDTVYPEEQALVPRSVAGFWMGRTEVTNAEFARFVAATGYVTVAERAVDIAAHPGLPAAMQQPGAVVFVKPNDLARGGDVRQWWQYLPGASWRSPLGPQSSIAGREAFAVVAVTQEDAAAYARWLGHELPSEAQWEWAARAGVQEANGSTVQPAQANTWQGIFPLQDTAGDGFAGAAPVGCYAPNAYGLFDMIGNVWELTRDRYQPFHDGRDNLPPDQPPVAQRPGAPGAPGAQYVIKGGSFLCAPNYCMRYRAGARQPQESDLATSHVGFRTILNEPQNRSLKN